MRGTVLGHLLHNINRSELEILSISNVQQLKLFFTAQPAQTPLKNQYPQVPIRVKTYAMIDSGASANFLSEEIVKTHKLPTEELPKPRKVKVIDGRERSSGEIKQTCTLCVTIENHTEEIKFFVTSLGNHHAILGMAWLRRHNPDINWEKETIIFSSRYCNENCLEKKTVIQANTTSPILELQGEDAIPNEYQQFSKVFSEAEDMPLLPHHPYDLSIDLEPGSKPKWGPIYNLSPWED